MLTEAVTAPPRPAVYPSSSKTLEAADRRTLLLADAMHRLYTEGECTRALLIGEGFSDWELEHLADAARAIARRGFVRDLGDAVGTGPRAVGARQSEGWEESPLTDEELLEEAYRATVGVLDTGLITSTLRGKLLWTHDRIARIWPRLMTKLASQLATTPIPAIPFGAVGTGPEAIGAARSAETERRAKADPS